MIRESKSIKELHAVMEQLHDKWAGMSAGEIVREISEGAETVKKAYGVTLKKPAQKKATVAG